MYQKKCQRVIKIPVVLEFEWRQVAENRVKWSTIIFPGEKIE